MRIASSRSMIHKRWPRASTTNVWRGPLIITVIVTLFLMGRWAGTSLNNMLPQATQGPSCAVSPDVAIRPSEMRGFEVITEGPLEVLPLKGQRFGASPLPITAEFRDGFVRGFISSRALTPEARALEAQRDEALGYSAGGFPVVPLAGPVVAKNPGILEVYQTTTDFRTEEAAHEWLDLRAHQLEGEVSAPDLAPPPAAARAFRYSMGDPDPEHEFVIRLLVQSGAIVSDFSVQSGGEVALARAIDLAKPSITRLIECARQERDTIGVAP